MKTYVLFLGLAVGGISVARGTEHLWCGFDAYPAGSLAANPGWACGPWVNTQTARVASLYALSPTHSLELPWDAYGSSAAYTNFLDAYNPTADHPVIRFSAKILQGNSNTFFQLGLRKAETAAFLSFQNEAGYGGVGFQYFNAVSVPPILNRFVDVTVFYNRSNNFYRLDYAYSNALPWTRSDVAPTVHTQFNQFAVSRLIGTDATVGDLFVDDVRVETFPPHVWAWWRCEDEGGAVVDHLGCFKPAWREYSSDSVRLGASDPVFDGAHDFHNGEALRELQAGPIECASATPRVTNWTVEAVFRMAPDEGPVCLLDWGTGFGFNATGSWIKLSYVTNMQSFAFNVRDAEQAGTDYMWAYVSSAVADGRWHHVALVKDAATLSLYLDYSRLTNIVFVGSSLCADGSYVFDPESHASIGLTLNNGNAAGKHTLIDEVRFSGKALVRDEFLQPGQPLIVETMNPPWNGPWNLAFKGIRGRSYRVETSAVFGAEANWQTLTNLVVSSTFGAFDVPPGARTNFVRIIRE